MNLGQWEKLTLLALLRLAGYCRNVSASIRLGENSQVISLRNECGRSWGKDRPLIANPAGRGWG